MSSAAAWQSMPFYPYNSPFMPPYPPPSPTSFTSPSNPASLYKNRVQYVIKRLNNRIKKCRGCGGQFSRKANGSLPDPPMDLVISHEEQRQYRDKNNKICVGKPQNVYYHSNISCIRRENAAFFGPELVLAADVTLLDSHKQYLLQYFNWKE